jgi:hypothetical protein
MDRIKGQTAITKQVGKGHPPMNVKIWGRIFFPAFSSFFRLRIFYRTILMCALLLPVSALATVPAAGGDGGRREIYAFAGIGGIYDDEGSLGKGGSGGGGFGYRLSNRFSMEGEVSRFQNRREFSSMYPPFQGRGASIMGSALWYFTGGRAEGYLIGGAGWLHYRTGFDFSGIRVDRGGNGFALNFGSGVKIRLSERIFLRPEFRILTGKAGRAVEPPLGNLRFSMGLGYRW